MSINLPFTSSTSIPSTAFDVGKALDDVGNFFNYAGDKVGTFVDNQLTGELDYNRQKELQARANAFTASESAKARDYNSRQAQIQRDFEERMSNSAYSRAFADMRKNGVNPYALMQGASTPSGAFASTPSGRGASASAFSSGQGAMHFLANVVLSAFNLAGKALANNGKVQAVQYFDRNGESLGGYHKYY